MDTQIRLLLLLTNSVDGLRSSIEKLSSLDFVGVVADLKDVKTFHDTETERGTEAFNRA